MDNGLNVTAIGVVSGCVLVWGLVSARLQRVNVSAPIAFVVMGLVLGNGPTALLHLHLRSSIIRSLAELTLALVLFSDASRVSAHALRADAVLSGRLLGIGLPLTIATGAALAAGLFAGQGLWIAALIGAIVAPTDAALGSQIIGDENVPARVRRAINVESGLNDGIATPFVNLFLAGGLASESIHTSGIAGAAVDLFSGAALGAGIGVAAAILLRLADRAGWSAKHFRPLAVAAVALLAYTVTVSAGANGFVAAFISGMAFGTVMTTDAEALDFVEESGTLLSLLVWFMFGAVMIVPGFQAAGWQDVAFAVLALTVVRMAPVGLALVGFGFQRSTVAFIGWFGPRGLASVVFGLVAIDALDPHRATTVLGAVTVTIALSVLAHGVSAAPLARLYHRRAERMPADAPERAEAPVVPPRNLTHRRLTR
jgi:NhaP-type Na+/H+ or K+/H+ antiporter